MARRQAIGSWALFAGLVCLPAAFAGCGGGGSQGVPGGEVKIAPPLNPMPGGEGTVQDEYKTMDPKLGKAGPSRPQGGVPVER